MIVGIDLGTTNSLISVYRDGKSVLIPNALGHFLTPSAISVLDDGSFLVGLPARERLATHPTTTVTGFKRWMGTDVETALGQQNLRAEELSALVLKSLKADAEAFLGEPVTEAVITVPAYFNDVQRRATKTAGELAGLKVERLLNEPTAAGLAYGLQERPDHTTFLIFDLGGGTFDVSVLTYFEGIVEVRASAGDARLGGDDFVQVLVEWFVEKNAELSAKDKQAILAHKALWRSAEQAKRDLSQQEYAILVFTTQEKSWELQVSRNEFAARCEPLLHRMRKPIERALADAKLVTGELNEVVMVGGASRMPMVRQLVTRLFARLPLRDVDPDETIARGAAIQAGLKARDVDLKEVVLTDVMPFSLGIVVSEDFHGRRLHDRFSPIIERNSAVPISRMRTYHTVSNNQTSITLDVRQGESPIGSENIKLGELILALPWGQPAGSHIQVRFTYDMNGILEVEAEAPWAMQSASTVITRNSEAMTPEQIELALANMQVLKLHPRDLQENVYLLDRAKRLYADFLGDERGAIAQALAYFEMTLDTQDERAIHQHRLQFKAFLDSMDKGFVL